MDFAIAHGRQNVLTTTEPELILFARLLRARCLLCESRYLEAQHEADRVLAQRRGDSEALYIKGEALYHQCMV